MSAGTAKCLRRATAAMLVSGWILIALFVGEMELLTMLPAPGLQVILFSLTALLLGAYWRITAFRLFVDLLPLRALVSLHLTRYVGIYFLILYAHGKLPQGFAVPAGWGDIAVAAGASLLVLVPPNRAVARRAMLGWNVLGLADILLVVATAARLGYTQPTAMLPLMQLPLSFLPLLLVPLIIATHVVIFWRLANGGKASAALNR